jgi:hypothetical protein
MAGFENYSEETLQIEQEIERKGLALGIDWSDDAQVRALAREAFDCICGELHVSSSGPVDQKLMTKLDLFGLAGIMLKTMEESASIGLESHGDLAWKAFAKALWAEKAMRDGDC